MNSNKPSQTPQSTPRYGGQITSVASHEFLQQGQSSLPSALLGGKVDMSEELLNEIKKLNVNSQLLTSAISSSYNSQRDRSATPLTAEIPTTISRLQSPKKQAKLLSVYGHLLSNMDTNFEEPLKPAGTPDCQLFLRGHCPYGTNCRYNHTINPHSMETFSSQSGILRKQRPSKKYPLRPDAPDCQYYLKTGRCNYGTRCRFNHPHRNQNLIESLNRRDCFDFVKTGICPYGPSCKYNHPQLAFVKSPGSSVTHSSSSSETGGSTVKHPVQVQKKFADRSSEVDGLINAALKRLTLQSNEKVKDANAPYRQRSQIMQHRNGKIEGPDATLQSDEREYSPLFANHQLFSMNGENEGSATWNSGDSNLEQNNPWNRTYSAPSDLYNIDSFPNGDDPWKQILAFRESADLVRKGSVAEDASTPMAQKDLPGEHKSRCNRKRDAIYSPLNF